VPNDNVILIKPAKQKTTCWILAWV